MFTGIITDIGTLAAKDDGRFEIDCHYDEQTIAIGASICCDGCCLTVTELKARDDGQTRFTVDVSAETRNVTTLDSWQSGHEINLERALKLGDEFGGHIVSGHVDGIATIKAMGTIDNAVSYTIEAPEKLGVFIAQKGSIALNGVSLTVNEVDNQTFKVTIIPHTLQQTTWKNAVEGTKMNIEVDTMARYALRASQIPGKA